jgi:hypothetical protein
MGPFLSSKKFSSSVFFIPLFDRGGHPFVPTWRSPARRAQPRSRMPLAAPAEPARSVLDGGEHGATISHEGTTVAIAAISQSASQSRERRAAQNNQRRACHHVTTIAPQPCIRCERIGVYADPPDRDAALRIGGEAPRKRAHSLPRRVGHGQGRVTATSDRLGVASRASGISAESCLTSFVAFTSCLPAT